MNAQLSGKVALVTGAGQGVGQGIAFALANAGASIAVAGRTASKLTDTCKEIERRGGRAIALTCDVTEPDQIAETVAKTVKHFGGLDILVNNAQEVYFGAIVALDDKAFERSFASGPMATLRFMQAAYPHLKASGEGNVINLGTASSARWDMAGYAFYAGVKETIRILTRAAAAEWGPDNIRVNTIIPLAQSPGMDKWIEADPVTAKAFLKTVPLGRVGDCERDIGEAVVQIVSPGFRYISGATIPIDGGQAKFA